MQAYRVETILTQDRKLTLENLPFHSGESIEVIILSQSSSSITANRYPLRGKPVHYTDPTEPVAVEAWEVLQ
ncbi:hypothetical protein WDW89_02890 [Deltaproteobacteria bacterium TL4]